MKTRILFVTFAVAAMLLPTTVFASSSSVAKYQTAGNKSISIDVSWFNKEISILNARKGLTDSRKAFLVSIANSDIEILNKMSVNLGQETDVRMAAKDYKSIKVIFSYMKSGIREAAGL